MSAEQAAPCRHAGAPPQQIVDNVSTLIRNLGSHTELLEKHGLTTEEYVDALPMAIEALRGSTSASNSDRRQFLANLFEAMLERGLITNLDCPQYGDDTVYRLTVAGHGDVAIIQKGCPDGAHSSSNWSVPDWATETYLWWLCSSLNYHPGVHVTKGVNRLRKRFFADNPGKLDGIVFHNQLCGTAQRPCKKDENSLLLHGMRIPPPCIYVMPGDGDGNEWNWHGDRVRIFPNTLLGLFDIPANLVPLYVGHVGFQRRGNSTKTTISSRFGPGRSTTHRS